MKTISKVLIALGSVLLILTAALGVKHHFYPNAEVNLPGPLESITGLIPGASATTIPTTVADTASDTCLVIGSETESSTVPGSTTTTQKDDGTVSGGLFTTNAEYRKNHKYCIAVNTAQNIVIVYTADSTGKYVVPYKAMVCSCGLSSTPTRLGTYYTPEKYRWRYLNGDCYGQYATRINGHYLFHSVPYNSQNPGDLKTAEYNKLGSPASEGCVRLAVKDAKWIYDNCSLGTCVTLYSNAGKVEPMAKPVPTRINPSSPNAGWDPTDPDPANPWH